jgi:hypothetical protein
MGNRKPSLYLRHLRGLAPDVPEDFLHAIWSSRLPTNIQAILAGQPEGSLDAAARCADRISEVASHPELVRPPTAPHFCRGSRTSSAMWQHSGLSTTVSTPAPGTLASASRTLEPTPGILVPAPGTAAR